MAGTEIYRKALRQFWRRAENADVTITAASPDTYSGTVTRFPWTDGTNPGIVDEYFYQAGQALIRVLMALTYDDVYKISPTLIASEVVTLTTGSGTLTATNCALIYDRQKVYTEGGGAIVAIAKVLDTFEKEEIINDLNDRKKPSTTNPYFEVLGQTVNVYPTSFTKIKLTYLKSCKLQISSNGNTDQFPEILFDIWLDMALRIAIGDSKDSLEVLIAKQLQEKFSFLRFPRLKTFKTQEAQR